MNMHKDIQPLIAGLDIGSSTIRIAIGQRTNRGESEENSELQILGASSVRSSGVNKGVINSIEDVVSSVSACLENAERMVGVPIDTAWVAISGLHIISQHSKGVVAVSKVDNEISVEDAHRAIEASRAIATPLNCFFFSIIKWLVFMFSKRIVSCAFRKNTCSKLQDKNI